tara:strand:+ start:157 stop:570 length:414 start_codon:yes stop_codon:yes gene_type:complete
MKNIWDWLKQINSLKADPSSFSDKDWEQWNSYMIHRFMSMNPDYLDLVNEAQQIMPQYKQEIYSIYREYIPKNNKWNKYIKSSIKSPNKELIIYLSKYWECSQTEAKQYVKLLESSDIVRILTSIGLEKKQIKPLLK